MGVGAAIVVSPKPLFAGLKHGNAAFSLQRS